ncbi:MAG TPA: CDP-alcohol phosphatidyltransferase family protein [Patescibacteria group bacterium]|nr:CDP-alcohol phosphatidyltransferase family protein [Patescibacteria group bacterium]
MSGKIEIRERLRGFLDPIVAFMSYLGLSPLAVTIIGIVLSIIGATFVARGSLLAGAVFLVVSGLCDTIDGSLARREGRTTTFGAFIDSTGDRITEMVYFGALVFYFINDQPPNLVVVFFLLAALAGSFLTSYTRARAEGLGLECRVGWVERPERIALLVLGLLLGHTVLIAIIVVLAFLTVFTFIQRVLHVRRLTLEKDL